MSRYRIPRFQAIACLLFLVFFSINNSVFAADGEALFKANCSSCHKPDEDYTGPALKGWQSRIPKTDKDWIYKWVANPAQMIATDPYAKQLFEKWKPTQMTAFGSLTKEEVDAILKYVDDYKPAADTKKEGQAGASKEEGGGSSLFSSSVIMAILLILALVGFILIQVNSNLRKLSDEKVGIERGEPVPFYRNMAYILVLSMLAVIVLAFKTCDFGYNLGRQKGYQPEQPIYYSHKVHAGTNQISCLYCHGNAQESKHAAIPSVNVCMNCHNSPQLSKYQGEPIVREDGSTVDGTAEIQKLYQYAGWNPQTKSYNPDNNGDGKPDGSSPIPWVKIHNLPDHVYFNHSQHIKVGKVQCQTCHGNIQEMPEVYQFTDLSMGWCINCHRESKVDFYDPKTGEGNKFYSIYSKFHNDLNNHKLDSVTVETIGGTECQKCHY